uniref:Uncharacterized protein n=1 Tax=Wuchereria bancrofti TaxID=6293 RepID=A0AAF5RY70_WUCBA
MREIIRNIYYYYPDFVENFLMIKKSRGKPAVSSSSKNTINVHLTFYLKTMGDSFIGKLLLFPLLKMQNPSDWRVPKCDTAGCKGWHCKSDEHSRNIQITFKTLLLAGCDFASIIFVYALL